MTKLFTSLIAILLFLFPLFWRVGVVQAQNIGINTTGAAANASSLLEVGTGADTKGLLIPRVSLSDVNSGPPISPAPGAGEESLLIYNTNASVTGGNGKGFYYWDGTKWNPVTMSTSSLGNTITGNVHVCAYGIETYSVCSITGATYNWTIGGNASIISGQGTNSISAQFGSGTVDDYISVTITGSCPAGTQGTLFLPVKSGSNTVTFSYTGAFQTWTVPTNVNCITIDAYGAEGAAAAGTGGDGGRSVKTIAVTPGEVLNIYVGGQGGQGGNRQNAGWNGGGTGGCGGACNDNASDGYGGGGATDIRRTPYGLADRLVVAGGGGGSDGCSGSAGGAAGGLTGTAGGNSLSCGAGSGGGGGTQAAGGTGGTACGGGGTSGTAGASGQGGNGGANAGNDGAGGGGGGYYGGGGGAGSGGGGCPRAASGGGGSGWCSGGCDIITGGVRTGNGTVTITY